MTTLSALIPQSMGFLMCFVSSPDVATSNAWSTTLWKETGRSDSSDDSIVESGEIAGELADLRGERRYDERHEAGNRPHRHRADGRHHDPAGNPAVLDPVDQRAQGNGDQNRKRDEQYLREEPEARVDQQRGDEQLEDRSGCNVEFDPLLRRIGRRARSGFFHDVASSSNARANFGAPEQATFAPRSVATCLYRGEKPQGSAKEDDTWWGVWV